MQQLLEKRPDFLAFVRRRVPDHTVAEDILQGAYMRAFQSAAVLRDEAATAWFYTVLRNAVIDFYRRRATEGAAMERYGDEPGPGEPTAPPPGAETFVCGCIQQVLPKLKPAYAEILREVDLAEQPLNDFARRHALTPANAAVRAHRARAALRRELLRFCGACTIQRCLDCFCKVPIPAAH